MYHTYIILDNYMESKEKQNLTIALSKSLLRKAKLAAVESESTLSQFVREALENQISNVTGYRSAKTRQLKILDGGLDLGTKGQIAWSRDDLYE